MKKYSVWYMKPDKFRELNMGYDWSRERGLRPNPAWPTATHTFVKAIEAASLDAAFFEMQGERWSPNGEAIELIGSLGLKHTSMSVGDLLIAHEDNAVYMVDRIGFRNLNGEEHDDGRAS